MQARADALTLIVLEQGAQLPSWASALRARSLHTLVEAQLPGEAAVDFQTRLERRLARLESAGQPIGHALYVCCFDSVQGDPSRCSLSSLAEPLLMAGARRAITGAILEAMVTEQPELVLACEVGSDDAECEPPQLEPPQLALVSLCGELSAAHPGSLVTVRFAAAPPESHEGVAEASSGVYRVRERSAGRAAQSLTPETSPPAALTASVAAAVSSPA